MQQVSKFSDLKHAYKSAWKQIKAYVSLFKRM